VGIAAAFGLIVLYARWAPSQGLYWPYPQRMPSHLNWGEHDLPYRPIDGCAPAADVERAHAYGLHQVGTLKSALFFGGPVVLAMRTPGYTTHRRSSTCGSARGAWSSTRAPVGCSARRVARPQGRSVRVRGIDTDERISPA
jgi:hypothetical protein